MGRTERSLHLSFCWRGCFSSLFLSYCFCLFSLLALLALSQGSCKDRVLIFVLRPGLQGVTCFVIHSRSVLCLLLWVSKHNCLCAVRKCVWLPPHSYPQDCCQRDNPDPAAWLKTASESDEKSPSVTLMGNRNGSNPWDSSFTSYSHGQSLLCSSQQNTEESMQADFRKMPVQMYFIRMPPCFCLIALWGQRGKEVSERYAGLA